MPVKAEHIAFARLFAAQVIALLGTGLMTVALGLLAYDLAGGSAGAVLGTALAIKMIAYVGLSPLAAALVAHLDRKTVLIGADLARAATALALPFVTEVWQIYLLVFVLQASSATFTPAFQAVIPDILTEEDDYTKALSLSRAAYEMETLISPALAGVLLLVINYHGLFAGTVLGFLVSAAIVRGTRLPPRLPATPRRFLTRATHGIRLYLRTPRLRGLLAMNMVAASAASFVLVNSVVLVRGTYGREDSAVALALAAFGAGSMLAALALPRFLREGRDRGVMTGAAKALVVVILVLAGIWASTGAPGWPVLLGFWWVIGALYSTLLTPAGRLLRRSAEGADRADLFTAHFALSHACWLVTYPLAGWAADRLGMASALALLGVLALLGFATAMRVWPATVRSSK